MEKMIVIKQDINFLDKPLWFADLRHDGIGLVWKDRDGFEYRSGYKTPDKTDAIILYYLLYKSQKLGYQEKITLTRYEILKACDFLGKNYDYYYARIEESLKRWKNITLEFKGTFYDGKKYKFYVFGIMDEAKIREEDKLVEVHFNSSWLLKIKESNFFKYMNFEYLKRLRRPVSLRLYELLAKNYKGRNECYFKLTTLGAKLTLSGRKVKNWNEEKEVIYASDVLVAIKPAINEINKLAKTPDIVEKTGIPPEDVFTLSFEIKGQKQGRVIYLRKHLVFPEKAKKQSRAKTAEATAQPNFVEIQTIGETCPTQPQPTPVKEAVAVAMPLTAPGNEEKKFEHPGEGKKPSILPKSEAEVQRLFALLKQRSSRLEKVICLYYEEKGFEYVKWNILYANQKVKKSYSIYLQRALIGNWAEEWAEEERKKIEAEEKRKEEERRKKEEEMANERLRKEAEKQKPLFLEKVKELELEKKKELWERAEQQVPSNIMLNRQNLIKINYKELLWEYLNSQGENFNQGLLNDLALSISMERPE